jgi:hypothetical protein
MPLDRPSGAFGTDVPRSSRVKFTRPCAKHAAFRLRTAKASLLGLLLFLLLGLTARAAIQFDVFLGYDGIIPEGSWFPVMFEVKNDGPPFTATVEVDGGQFNAGQVRRMAVELPTGTLKRFVIPMFSTTSGYSSWDARLYDERGKVRSEQVGLRARLQLSCHTPLMGALPRSAGGTPTIAPILPESKELHPATARLLPTLFPDNPLVLEGMSSIYLNSERAADLTENQVNALFGWLNAGGHLIVAVEQPSDITSAAWLKSVFPCDLKDVKTLKPHFELQAWLKSATWATNASARRSPNPPSGPYGNNQRRSTTPLLSVAGSSPFSDLGDDYNFETAGVQVVDATVREGQVIVQIEDSPVIVTTTRGRGRVTALLFSPEREPFRSWKNLPKFWAKLAEVPGEWYLSKDYGRQGAWSSDGIFGAMIDSRQVHKLPIGWLLLLLVVYLVVIGPLDQLWLKRIGKPMLTWITFPCYVALFSLLIYFIGYKLRSGESEWNELHVVDVLLNRDRAELRGRTYSSVYSPSNQKYRIESDQRYATLRGEFYGLYSGGQSTEKAEVQQAGDGYKADVFVPVWTSQLLVSDWWQPAAVPLSVTIKAEGEKWLVQVQNNTDHALSSAQVAIESSIFRLGEIPATASKSFSLSKEDGTALKDFVGRYSQSFGGAVQSRQRAFGGNDSGRISDLPNSTVAASFISQMGQQDNFLRDFITPPGLDVSGVVEHGSAMVFAWAGDYSPIKAINHFTPRRTHRDTMWRVAVSIQ